MPESGQPIFKRLDDIRIPADLLTRPAARCRWRRSAC